MAISLKPDNIAIISPSQGTDVKPMELDLWCARRIKRRIGKFVRLSYGRELASQEKSLSVKVMSSQDSTE